MERGGALKEKRKNGVFRGEYGKWRWVGNLKREEKKSRGMEKDLIKGNERFPRGPAYMGKRWRLF